MALAHASVPTEVLLESAQIHLLQLCYLQAYTSLA